MINYKKIVVSGIIVSISLFNISACSVIGKAGKTARNMTSFNSQQNTGKIAVDEQLTIPPTLKMPTNTKAKASAYRRPSAPKATPVRYKPKTKKNYYIVVGTYPNQEQALDTFVRLSSIGLSGAAMESRQTKSGQVLHMVRLGPYNNQEDIDSAKDSLTSDGLSQFKVVEN